MRRLAEHRAAGVELDDVHFVAAAEATAEKFERSRHCLLKHIHADLPDERTYPELRIIQVAGERQLRINDARAIPQQRDRKSQMAD